MKDSFVILALIYGIVAVGITECTIHKPSDLDKKNVLYFGIAMRQYPAWEKLNATYYGGLKGQLDGPLAKLRQDLMNCDKLRNDSEAFNKCNDKIDADYAVLSAIEDSLRFRPRHI